jgi:8-oxo-dGTP pyrophosphatase MutT (NUDIX family)
MEGGLDARTSIEAALGAHRPTIVGDGEADQRAAVMLVLRQAGQVDALFVRRAEAERDPWSGHMALPGGRADPEDPDLVHTALRELREETGLEIPPRRVLGRLDDVHPSSRQLPSIAVTPFVSWLDVEARIEPNPEIQDHIWIPLAVLRDPEHQSELRVRTKDADRVFPTIEYRDYTIWGLTLRIIHSFLAVIGQVEARTGRNLHSEGG